MNLMTLIKRIASTVGCVVLAALLLALVAPKAVHGVVAALVQVANPPTNPVATLDASGTFPYVVQIYPESITGPVPPITIVPYTPTGQSVRRLVIEQVAASCSIYPSTAGFATSLSVDTDPGVAGDVENQYFFPVVQPAPGSTSSLYLVAPTLVHILVPAGGQLSVIQNDGPNTCFYRISGHLEAQ